MASPRTLLASLVLPLWAAAAQMPAAFLPTSGGFTPVAMWPSAAAAAVLGPPYVGVPFDALDAHASRQQPPQAPAAPATSSSGGLRVGTPPPPPARHLVPPLVGPPPASASPTATPSATTAGGRAVWSRPRPPFVAASAAPVGVRRRPTAASPRPTSTPRLPPRPSPSRPSPTTPVPPAEPTAEPREKLIFAEEFDTLDPTVWSHLVTAWRGGNREFQYYRDDRRNSYVRGGVLYLRPTLTASETGEAFLYTGRLAYPDCNFKPCESESGSDIVLPVQSARIHTASAFSYRYGRLEVRAKLPRGDWIWPAIWLKPATNAYGSWPASGEMDLVESRGNAHLQTANGEPQGVQKVGATLHFGPNSSYNIWRLTHWEKILEQGDFADDFHVFGLEWSPEGFRITVDQEEIGSMPPPQGGFWGLGGFDADPGGPNIWANGTALAPFDKKFYIILNVAVGGTFFPNGMLNSPYPRPWNWTSGHPLREFWEHRHWWLPSWRGENAAMQVDYVRVYQTVA